MIVASILVLTIKPLRRFVFPFRKIQETPEEREERKREIQRIRKEREKEEKRLQKEEKRKGKEIKNKLKELDAEIEFVHTTSSKLNQKITQMSSSEHS